MSVPYIVTRIMVLISIVLMFFPSINPVNIITQAGQAKIRFTASLFTSSVSYSSVTNGLGRAFTRGWVSQGLFVQLFIACIIILLGVILTGVGGCMSVGSNRMKTIGNRFLLGGSIAETVGMIYIIICYNLIVSTADASKIETVFPKGIIVFTVIFAINLLCSIIVFLGSPKTTSADKFEMESKYKLFLMLLPFLALVFAFSYLPLFSWRYAFFDYAAGGELSRDNFVGFYWFKQLFKSPAYVKRILNVIKNTLGLSGMGILTSWLPMAFAIFLTEIKSTKFKRFVQTFTTIPNFISWVLVYAIAFAIFNTDGFVNSFINSIGGNASANYLQSSSHMWLKMWAWGTWKGVGWSAIIYISGIAGIDQQLYEAATVDGAGRFQRMIHITLPGLLPTYVVMLVMSIAGILSNGMDQYLVFTNANNKDVIEVLDLYVYNLGIGNGSIPLSTVVGMAKSIISVILLFIANTASKLIRGNGVV